MDKQCYPNIPKGRITSLSCLFVSCVSLYFLYGSDDIFKNYFYMGFAIITFLAAIYIYCGRIPCKECAPEEDVEAHFLCPRCTGFYVGVILFNLIVLFFHLCGAPALSTKTGYILLVFGVICGLPAMLHGIMRRYLNKDFSPKNSLIILYLSGFAVAMGGFLVALSLITILK